MPARKTWLYRRRMFLWLVAMGLICLQTASAQVRVDHGIFSDLLSKYNRKGVVDYAGFKKEEKRLDAYLEALAKIDPEPLSQNDQFAFYVNAYNAWTIKLILSGYPGVKSIKDLGSLFKSPWKQKIVKIGSQTITLDHIEHDILRPVFKDARVHFAVNCASKGCPPLYPEPFDGDRLDEQLDDATRRFVNDGSFNRLEGDTLYVSRIFKWFGEDFDDDIVGFFSRYAAPEMKNDMASRQSELKIRYLDYDWSLNGS